jgi:hypothetical protein
LLRELIDAELEQVWSIVAVQHLSREQILKSYGHPTGSVPLSGEERSTAEPHQNQR